jgi:lipoyl(octanoyl) transferase
VPLAWSWLGRLPYEEVWQLQERQRDAVLAGEEGAERLFFVEHEPVVTLGRSADPAHVLLPPALLAARGVGLVRTNRGGDVTVHAPGQLVIYPVVRLTRGVRAHVEAIGGAIVEEARARGVACELRRAPVGVWVGQAKLAACGLHVKRRVAVHGFALNVTDEPLGVFELVVPCGLRGTRVTSLAQAGGVIDPLPALAASLAVRIGAALGRDVRQENLAHVSITTCSSSPSR